MYNGVAGVHVLQRQLATQQNLAVVAEKQQELFHDSQSWPVST